MRDIGDPYYYKSMSEVLAERKALRIKWLNSLRKKTKSWSNK